jgi:hypothetical protein
VTRLSRLNGFARRGVKSFLMLSSIFIAMFLVPSTAGATTHVINGTVGYTNNCFHTSQLNYYDACLFYDGLKSSLYGMRGSVSNLSGKTFSGGNGDGSGHSVINNANYIECTPWVSYYCYSYYNQNYTGNADVIGENEYGALYLTWNNEASVYIDNG